MLIKARVLNLCFFFVFFIFLCEIKINYETLFFKSDICG